MRRTSKAPPATAAASTGTTPARRTMFGLACLCVLGLIAFTGSSAPTVGAAESFPGQGFLPDNRAWEMVSPPDKHGGNVATVSARTQAAADGDAVSFASTVGFADVRGTNNAIEYIAQRSAQPGTNGWGTHAITPRLKPLTIAGAGNSSTLANYMGDLSPDLSHGAFFSGRPIIAAPNVEEVANLFEREDLRSPGAGSYELLTDAAAPLEVAHKLESPPFEFPPVFVPFILSQLQPAMAGASTDFSHVIFESRLALTPDTSFSLSDFKLYENAEGTVRLVGRIPHPARSLTVHADGGTFTLNLNGESTEAIAFDAPAGTIEAALNALPSVSGSGSEVNVTGGPGSSDGSTPYLLVFNGSLAASANPTLSADPSALTGTGAGAEIAADPRSYSCDDAGGPSEACLGASSSQPGIFAGGSSGDGGGSYSARMISADGSRIFFQAPFNPAGGNIYLREDGTRTFLLNASEKESPGPPAGGATLWDASRDGSRVFFIAGDLVDEDEDGSSDLYMYEVEKPEGERLTLLSGDVGALTVIGASDDGHYVYFLDVSGFGIYLWHDGEISYIGRFASFGETTPNAPRTNFGRITQAKTSRVTPDGHRLLFMTQSDKGFKGIAGFGGYDHGPSDCTTYGGLSPCRELYTYDADTHQLRCASCNPSGATATGNALDDVNADTGPISQSSHQSQALSDDGRYVFFSTAERLVGEDTNGTWDAYEYDTSKEEPRLLSSGEDKAPSYFLDASADGKDVFIATAEQLSRWDTDTNYDLYDARVDGGLPEPVPPPPSCQGDACQPTPLGLNDPTPASSSFKGAGNPNSRKPSPRCGQGKRRVKTRAGKSRCVKRKNGATQHRTAKHNRRAGR